MTQALARLDRESQTLDHDQPPQDRPATKASFEIVHQSRGRVRLRVPRIKFDSKFAAGIGSSLIREPGIVSARVNRACASLIIEYGADELSIAAIESYLARDREELGNPSPAPEQPDFLSLASAGLAAGLGLLGAPAGVTLGLLAIGVAPVWGRAVRRLRQGKLSVDALDAAAISILTLRGQLVGAAVSATLIACGEYLRSMTARRSRHALSGLLATPDRPVWVVRGSRRERVPVGSLAAGDVVIAYPGDLIVVDGIVLRGRGLVDQKTLTGESRPVAKGPGDAVFMSTVVTDGKLYVTTERTGQQTRAQRIVEILENVPVQDSRIADSASRFGDRLVLPTFGLAAATLAFSGDPSRAASVLMFDLATGIRISSPTTVRASMTAAAGRNVLIKGGRALERLAEIDTLIFDKTGTLTTGAPVVTAVEPYGIRSTSEEVLALAAAAEARLSHPVARSICFAAERKGVRVPERAESSYQVGLGTEAEVEGQHVLVGSRRFLSSAGIALRNGAKPRTLATNDRAFSRAYVARNGFLIGSILFADRPRPEAQTVVRRLRRRGIEKQIIVTGDDEDIARLIGQEVGIEEVVAGVFPEEKAEIVRGLQGQGHVVGVVGDGINDSLALAHADVSISLESGTDVARETADIVLHGDLHGLPESIDIAHEAMRLNRQNVGIIAGPNAIGLLLASCGVVGPIGSTLLNNGSAIVAGLNSLRPLARKQARRGPVTG